MRYTSNTRPPARPPALAHLYKCTTANSEVSIARVPCTQKHQATQRQLATAHLGPITAVTDRTIKESVLIS